MTPPSGAPPASGRAPRRDVRRVIEGLLKALVTVAFLAAGSSKFQSQSSWNQRFEHWGYPHWFLLVTGVLETAGAVGLWIPRLTRWALSLLGVVMIGAVVTHLMHPPLIQATTAVLYLVLLVGIGWARRSRSDGPPARRSQ